MSDVGQKRRANEDSFVADAELGLFVVADGMGGQAAGEVASKVAVEAIYQFIKLTDEQRDITWPTGYITNLSHGQNRLRTAMLLANQEIYRSAQEDAGLRGMGTTVVCSLVEEDRVDIAHVGDSRVYLLRAGELEPLTSDHSWIREQVGKGVITEDQARNHPYRNVVTRALGAAPEVEADFDKMQLRNGDLLMLCTDGLNSMLSDAEMEAILNRYGADLDAAARALVFEANQKGGEDNITVILMSYLSD